MRSALKCVVVGIALSGVLAANACSGDPARQEDTAIEERGSMQLALQTTSASGKVYRLRNATFFVDRFAFGPAPTPPSTTQVVLRSEDDPTRPVIESFLIAGFYEILLTDGWFIEQVDSLLGTSTFVPATLLNGPFQFFDIQSNEETFVQYQFEVDGERVTFGPPGRLIVGIGVHERSGACGNGRVDFEEACDGFDLNGETCASVTLGLRPTGFLQCTPSCTFDIRGCIGFDDRDGGIGGMGGMGSVDAGSSSDADATF